MVAGAASDVADTIKAGGRKNGNGCYFGTLFSLEEPGQLLRVWWLRPGSKTRKVISNITDLALDANGMKSGGRLQFKKTLEKSGGDCQAGDTYDTIHLCDIQSHRIRCFRDF